MSYQQFFKKAQDIKRRDPPSEPSFKIRSEADTEKLLRQAVRMKAPKKRQPVPWKATAGLVIGLVLGGAYLVAPDSFEKLIERIEVHAIGGAEAAEKSQSTQAKSEKAAASSSAAESTKVADAKSAVTEDLSHFGKLKERKEELDAREKELNELEEELQRQKLELDKRIVQLEETRGQIAQILKDRVEVDQEKVNKLVDLYSNMKPKQAADVIGSINEELAVEVLAKMKKKNAAEIMNLLSPEKARILSEKYTGYRRNRLASDSKG